MRPSEGNQRSKYRNSDPWEWDSGQPWEDNLPYMPKPPLLKLYKALDGWHMKIMVPFVYDIPYHNSPGELSIKIFYVTETETGDEYWNRGRMIWQTTLTQDNIGLNEFDFLVETKYYAGYFYGRSYYKNMASEPTDLIFLPDQGEFIIPQDPLSFDITEDGILYGNERQTTYEVFQGTQITSRINVQYQAPGDLRGFKGVKLYVQDYKSFGGKWFLVSSHEFDGDPYDIVTFQDYLLPYAQRIVSWVDSEINFDFIKKNANEIALKVDMPVGGWPSGYPYDIRKGDFLVINHDNYYTGQRNCYLMFEILGRSSDPSFSDYLIGRLIEWNRDGLNYWNNNPIINPNYPAIYHGLKFSLVAYNGAGWSKNPEDGLIRYCLLDGKSSRPFAPTNIKAEETELNITLFWDTVDNQEVIKYIIWRAPADQVPYFPSISDFSVVQVIGEVPHKDSRDTGQARRMQFIDNKIYINDPDTQPYNPDYDQGYYYWIIAQDASGLESYFWQAGIGPLYFRRTIGIELANSAIARHFPYNLLANALFRNPSNYLPIKSKYYTALLSELTTAYNGAGENGASGTGYFWVQNGLASGSPLYYYDDIDTNGLSYLFIAGHLIAITAKGTYNGHTRLTLAEPFPGYNGYDTGTNAFNDNATYKLPAWDINLMRASDNNSGRREIPYWTMVSSMDTPWFSYFDYAGSPGKIRMGALTLSPSNGANLYLQQIIGIDKFFEGEEITLSVFLAVQNPSASVDVRFEIVLAAESSGGLPDYLRGRGILQYSNYDSYYTLLNSQELPIYTNDSDFERFIYSVKLNTITSNDPTRQWSDYTMAIVKISLIFNAADQNTILHMVNPMLNPGTEASQFTESMGPEKLTMLRAYSIGNIQVDPSNPMCIAQGQDVSLYYGNIKKVENLKQGDELLSYNFNEMGFCKTKVLSIKSSEEDCVEIIVNHKSFIASEEHLLPVMHRSHYALIKMKDVQPGDIVLTLEGMKSIMEKRHVGRKMVYKINLTKPKLLFVNGILTHNDKGSLIPGQA